MEQPFRIIQNTICISPDTRVLRAEEYASLIEAQNILEAAQERAEQVLRDSQQAFDDAKKQGYDDGVEEGKLEHAEKMMDTLFESVAFVERLEQASVKLVQDSIAKVLGDLPENERIASVVRNGLRHIQNENAVTIKVSIAEQQYVRDSLIEINSAYPAMTLDVVGDKRLQEGDCILETAMGVVDCGLTTQLNAINKALARRFTKEA